MGHFGRSRYCSNHPTNPNQQIPVLQGRKKVTDLEEHLKSQHSISCLDIHSEPFATRTIAVRGGTHPPLIDSRCGFQS